ncbi:hypothetical protein K5V21_15825 [Clostridium sardiniense]|uniref:Uncharacterized protein n=1 Tax=Clostridium sardiniense TaxID=29369 RepID=A0ABS7L1H2_CLOSR|nr:hypothetical protein [Clostridium sardiniense]MBM7833491.1 NAD-dependent DNA ligase [Clostridium sardiniense]MBY0756914.1 hypothetical protein [Clostridium sardiniense]MDQ0458759.1 NAD-dependent DNA ligase [Clostridium sardiniense]
MLRDYYVEFQNISRIFNEYCKNNEECIKEAKDDIIDYLSRLDMKIIKDIKVILHIGKNESNNCIHTPIELYKRTMTTFDVFKGWGDKESEVASIIENTSLNEYFDNGLSVLDMK